MRRSVAVVVLCVVWVALWGQITLANVVGGLVVALLVTAFTASNGPRAERHLTLNPLASLAFAWLAVRMLAASTWETLVAITRPHTVRSAVVAVQMRSDDPVLVTLVANTVTLTPGTMTLAVTDPPVSLYVHVLRFSDRASVEADVARLEDAAAAALQIELGATDRGAGS